MGPADGPHARSEHEGERLQKILARAGIAARRSAEELIKAGRVRVNGEVVTEMGTRANPTTDHIQVDGRSIDVPAGEEGADLVYIMLNKPSGVVSTAKDPQGRTTVLDLIQPAHAEPGAKPRPGKQATPSTHRIYPVGRLDTDTTGLLLLTNDGELTFRLTHPRYGVEKEYRALVRGHVGEDALRKLREGIEIEGEKTAPAKVEVVEQAGGNTRLRIIIHEGRKRQVRLMCAAVDHPVIDLHRVRFGPLTLSGLDVGKWRNLALHEIHALRKAVRLKLNA